MQFRELVLHNVGVYRGRQAINLTTPSGRPVVLVGGLNGCGKTTFLDSLQLALYGRRARLSTRGAKSWDAYLRETISRGVDPGVGASVELVFDVNAEGGTREYRVVRAWSFGGKSLRESTTIFVDGRVDDRLSRGWTEYVEEILPLELANLFFFDGEKIESLADSETASAVIRTSIHSLLGIGTIEQLSTDLMALQRRQARQVPEAEDGQAASLDAEAARLEGEQDVLAQRSADAHNRLSRSARESERIEARFEREGGRLYEQRAELERERSARAAELARVHEQLRGAAEGVLPLAIVEPQVADLIRRADGDEMVRDARRLRSSMEQRDSWILAQLPDAEQSRLGRLLEQNRAELTESADKEFDLELDPALISELSSCAPTLPAAVDAAAELARSAGKLAEDLASLDSQIAAIPAGDAIAAILEQRESARIAIARIEGELDAINEERARVDAAADRVKTDQVKLEAERRERAAEDDYVRRLLEHTDRARETLAALRSRLIETHIGKIEVATLEAFGDLMRKRDLVADIRIDKDDFRILLLGQDGEELPSSRLSAGERQLLAVALLWGLAKVAGNRLPTVIDTPLGRLDSSHRSHLVERYFPNAGSQVLLLSTDKEIDEDLFSELHPALGASYLLVHDDAQHTTTIEPGYWWTAEADHVA